MKKTQVLFALLFTFTLTATLNQSIAQNTDKIKKRLSELGFSSDLSFKNLSENTADYSYKATFTEITSDKTTVEIASFDPRKAQGSRWTLESVNGGAPSKKDIKKFDKIHNSDEDDISSTPDENSLKIVSDDEHFLVIGLKYKEADLPQKSKFIAQCDAEVYFDKEAKRLYKVKFFNKAPLKIKIFNVVKLDMTIELMLSDDGKSTVLKDQNTVMDVKMLGQMVEITEKTEYYNYQKVK